MFRPRIIRWLSSVIEVAAKRLSMSIDEFTASQAVSFNIVISLSLITCVSVRILID